MNSGATVSKAPATARRLQAPNRTFLRHLGEMLLAMFLGMLVLGGATQGIFAIAGSSLSDTSASVQAALMGFDMTVPMVAWMHYRGHPLARSVEMAAAMILPTLGAIALHAIDAIGSEAVLAVQHIVMIPAMVAVMLWRREHYSHGH